MPTTQFDRNKMAHWYGNEHRKTDPGIATVYFLPANTGEREIRIVEVNHLLGNRNDDALEPIDFGVDTGMDTAHKLFVLDVSPEQWHRIQREELGLPANWSLAGAIELSL